MSSNKWLFSANNGTNGIELWVTDGTDAGTFLLKDIYPGFNNALPSTFTNILDLGNGKVVFSADNGTQGSELWVTDGTTAGTQLLKNVDVGDPYGSNPTNFIALGLGKALFTPVINRLGKNGELWVTDGTDAGTVLVKDIYAGTSGSTPTQFSQLGSGKVLFNAWDANQGYELWVSNGTSAGTTVLHEYGYANGGGGPANLIALGNGKMVFDAWDSVHGRELWVSDGTVAGTTLLTDIAVGTNTSIFQPKYTALGNGKVIFEANNGTTGYELWVTNGTTAGTFLLKDINPGTGGSNSANFHVLGNGKTLFATNDGTNNGSLWITDGTTVGTSLLKDVNVGAGATRFHTMDNGKTLFSGVYGGKTGLWTTDGTTAGTLLIRELGVGDASGLANFTSLGNGKVVFVADGGWPYGRELWITDGTDAGTMMVKDITTGLGNSSILGNFTSIGNGKATFAAGSLFDQLWVTDGTDAGTFMLEDYSAAFGKPLLLQGSDRVGTSGNNILIGDAQANMMNGLAGNDTLIGGGGADTLNGGAGADTLVFNAVVGTFSDSRHVIVSGVNNDKGQDTLTAFGLTEDTIRIVATNVTSFVHGTDTTIGAGTGPEVAGDRASFSTATGLIELNQTANNNWSDLGDIAVTFVSPSVALTETGFEARLQYNLTGTALANTLTGGRLNDTLSGGNGNDVLTGSSGADTLNGGTGADTLIVNAVVGTSSDSGRVVVTGVNNDKGQDILTAFSLTEDTIRVVATNVTSFIHGTDTTIGVGTGSEVAGNRASFSTATGLIELNQTANNNWSDFGDIAVTFVSPSVALTETGFEARLQYNLTGTTLANTLTGGSLSDTLRGGSGNDTLSGSSGNDTLYGDADGDLLRGGAGNDILYGGAGQDLFRFDTTPSGKVNVDQIKDFVVADDTIQLKSSIFTKFGTTTTGTLNADYFKVLDGVATQDTNDYVVFSKTTGALYYDTTGSTNGLTDAVQFATVTLVGTAPLTNVDFALVL